MKIKIKSLIISTSFLLVLFCFASADGMIQSDRDFIHSVFDSTNWGVEQWATVESVMDSCPYFIIFPHTDGLNYTLVLLPYNTNQYYDFYWNGSAVGAPVTDPQIMPWIHSSISSAEDSNYIFGYNWGGLMPYSLGDMSYSDSKYNYTYYIFDSYQNSLGFYGYAMDINSVDYSASSWNFYWYDEVKHGRNGFYSSNGDFTRSVDRANVKCNYNAVIIRYSYTGFETFKQNVFPVQFTEDSRLKLSHVFGLGGVDELLINMSEFYTETGASPASGTTFSDVTLTVKYTDFQDQVTTQDFVLSSSNSILTHSSYPSTLIHLVETPYSVFGNFEDYSKIEITGCSFTRTYNVITQDPQVDNFNIACSFVLKAATASSDLEPEDIDLPEYEDPKVVSQNQIEVIRQQLQEDSTAPNANTGDWEFVQDHPVVPSWADHYDFRVIYSDVNSFIGNLVNANIWNYYTSNDPNGLNWITSGFVPREFLHNNSAALFYDMIIISVYEANVNYETPGVASNLVYRDIELQGYLVFYSQRYYIHRQALTQQDILSVLEYESYNDILYYTYVKDKLDDFENKTTLGFSKMIGLQGSTNSWLSSLDLKLTGTNQQLGQILAAINNIDIPEAPKLSEITDSLEYLFIPSFSWTNINYNEYLDSLGILSMPFRFGSSVFSGLENGYSPNLEYHLYEASVPLPASLGVSGNSFKLWDDQDFTLVTASIVPDQDLLANIRLFNLIVCIMSQAFLTYLHIFRREGGVEDGI